MGRTLDNHFDYFCLAVLLILAYVLFFHQLGGLGFVGPDEPRYAAVAREMFETGDYVTPHLMGEPWLEKPALLYWLASIGYAVFGVGEIGARMPSAVAATLTMLTLFWCGRRLYSRRAGFAAAIVLATSVGTLGLARAASTDMLLSAALGCALAVFLVAQNSEGLERRRYFYLFYALIGLGALAKGPVALLLPALALGVFLIWRGGAGEWRTWHPEGLAVTGLVAGPWYLAVWWANGWPFVEEFLIGHNLRRFTSETYGHGEPFYFFVPVFILMMFPWTFLLIGAVRRRLDKNEHLMVAWAVIPFVFFSVSGSKLPAYILPMAVPVALLLARELSAKKTSLLFRAAVVLEALTWLSFGVVAVFFRDLIRADVPVGGGLGLLGLTIAAAAGLLVAAAAFPPPVLGTFNTVVIVGLVLILTGLVFPGAQAVESVRPWVRELGDLPRGGEEIVLYKPPAWMEYGFQFYLNRRVPTIDSEEDLIVATETGARYFCVSESATVDQLSVSDRIAVQIVGAMGSQTAFWVWQP